MKFKSLLLAGLCLLAQVAIGKNEIPQVFPTNNYQSRICSNTQADIPVQIYGKFNADNRFFVELLSYLTNKSLATYEAVLQNGHLVFMIGNEVSETYDEIKFRISTTSPATQTSSYSNKWYTRGELSIARPIGDSDTLNAGMSYNLNVNLNANNAVKITLSDSSIREIQPSGYQQTIGLIATKAADIFIVKAVNSCNVPVPFSGRIPLVINPISVSPVKVNSHTALCEGNEIELAYAVTGGTIPESATFRLRFFRPYPNANEKQIFEVPATKKANGVLVARIPEKMGSNSTSFHVAVLVDKPALVSSYLKWVSIYEKPVATFRSQSETAGVGEPFSMWFNISGPEPYTIELNNGVKYSLDGNRSIAVYPLKTETFSIRSLRTACGVTTDLPKQTVVASLPPGIAINAPTDQKWTICENQKVRLPFVTNATLTANTKFIAEGLTYNNTTYQFEAKLVNDSIEFLIPHSSAEWIKEGYFSIKSFRIKTTNPSLTSPYKGGFNIQGIPRVSYQTNDPRTMSGPQFYEFTLNVSGGLPYTLTDDQGTRIPIEYPSIPRNIFVPATGGYGLKSVENGCYSNSDLARLNLTVNPNTSQEPVIVVHPPASKYLCTPDSVEVWFEAFGKFGEGNEFQIVGSVNQYSAPLLTVKKPGKYKIAAATLGVPSYEWISVKATNPAVQAGSRQPFIIDTKPALLYPELGGTPENPRVFGIDDTPSLPSQFKSNSPYTAEFTSGGKDYHFEKISDIEPFRPVIPRSKVTPYTLKSITNACGTLDVNQTTYLYWVGYALSMKYFPEDKRFCTGQEMVVPFNVERGSAPAGTTYRLQMGKIPGEFTTVASSTTLEDFRYTIPESMEGEYFLRIITDTGIEGAGKRFFVNKIPAATISLNNQVYAEIDYGQSAYLDYNLTGGGPWELIMAGQGNFTATNSPFTQSYALLKGTVFQIQSISNQCGYGSVSGSANVRVRPKIVTFKAERSSVCSGENINVKYEIGGDIPTGEKVGFYVKDPNGKRFELASSNATTGNVMLPLPAAWPGGYYVLVCYITGSDISESFPITIFKTPDIELTGNTTINPAETAFILLRSTSGGNVSMDVSLSDGTRINSSNWAPGSYYSVQVKPAATTTYTIASATGHCGSAKSSGSATVTVNPPSARTVRVTGVNKTSPFCEKDTLKVYYALTGTFSAGNQFTVQFYDNQGKLVNSLPTIGKESPLHVVVPASFITTEPYHIRLAASDANTASSDFAQIARFGTKANASFASSNATLDDKGNASAVVLLTGTGPWQYSYGNDLGSSNRYATISPDTLHITSKEPSAYFRLTAVSNGCGAGTISEPSTVKVEIVLGTEDPGESLNAVAFGPNPTNGRVMLHFKTVSKRLLYLYNANGVLMSTTTISGTVAEVDIRQYVAGNYLLKIEHLKGRQILRIMKE